MIEERFRRAACLIAAGLAVLSSGVAVSAAFGASALPDGRQYEMVSPPSKGGALVGALIGYEGNLVQAAPNGEALTWGASYAIGSEPAGNVGPEWSQMLSTRGAEEWRSQDIAGPHEKALGIHVGNLTEYFFFSSDLGLGIVQQKAGSETPLSSPPQEATIYLRDNASGTYEPLVSSANTPAGTKFGGTLEFLAATPDASHVILESTVALTPEAKAGSENLYEWADGRLRLASVLPDGAAAQSGNGLNINLGRNSQDVRNALSSDGARVIYEGLEQEGHEGGEGEHLYMRDMESGETVQVDAPQGGSEEGEEGQVLYQDASEDGGRVFFTSEQSLTSDASTEYEEPDLYLYEVTSKQGEPLAGELTDLTADANPEEHANVQNLIPGVSAEGSYVYLVATGVLAENKNENKEAAKPKKDNLYVLHDTGAGWTTSFIARLSSEDSPDWGPSGSSELYGLTSSVSPNGRYLAFMSDRSLTGYENDDAHSGVADEEVYLYDAESGRLVCASCDPSGARPEGVESHESSKSLPTTLVDGERNWNDRWLAGSVPGWNSNGGDATSYQPRYLSNSGRLFFNSPADLVSGASNGKEDVYEYEPEGIGDCEAATGSETDVFVAKDAGCVGLISGGGSEEESAFLDAGESGGDVFFLTAEKLVGEDTDTALDIYDAHECNAAAPCFPAPVTPPAPCIGDGCQGAVSPAPSLPVAPSLTQAPGDNVLASPKPTESKSSKAKPKQTARAKKLARALRMCKKKGRIKRASCERRARKRYGAAGKASEHRKATQIRSTSTHKGTSR